LPNAIFVDHAGKLATLPYNQESPPNARPQTTIRLLFGGSLVSRLAAFASWP
jgi:hypothetical protein